MAFKKGVLIVLILFLLPIAYPAKVSTYKQDGDVMMNIHLSDYPKIVKQTGFEKKFDYTINQVSLSEIEVTVCHKDFEKTKNTKLKDNSDLDNYKVLKNGNLQKNLKLKSNKCDTITVQLAKGEILKFGEQSTEIIITDDNVTLVVSPEQSVCDYLFCNSEIKIINYGTTNLTINTSDLQIQIESDNYWLETELPFDIESSVCDDIDCNTTHYENFTEYRLSDENREIVIEPGTIRTFYVNAIMPDENTEFKYNVSFFYINKTYIIDPYFNTTSTTFNNGAYNNTLLNASGFVQLSTGGYNGSYLSEIFNGGSLVYWDNISWTQEICHGCELPNNAGTDNGDYVNPVNMANNELLYHFNNNSAYSESDTVVHDFSGNSRNGVSTAFVNKVNVKFGEASIRFQRTRKVTISPNFATMPNWTISAWVYPTSNLASVDNGYMILSNDIAGFNDDVNFGITPEGTAKGTNKRFQVIFQENIMSTYTKAQDTTDVVLNRWYHVVAQANGDNLILYVNGVKKATTPKTGSDLNYGSQTSLVGYSPASPLRGFNGSIDELVVYNRALSETEIKNMYKRGIARLNLSVRSCNDAVCSGENWSDVINDTSLQKLNVDNNTYFQYKFDFFSQTLPFTPKLYNVTIGYDGLICVENWIAQYGSCQTNDSWEKTYYDDNGCGTYGSLPGDNGTYDPCNYCTEDLNYLVVTECFLNGTDEIQEIQYFDNNYLTCCIITGFVSDCSILYEPYNHTEFINCSFLQDEFDLQLDQEVYFGFGFGGLASDKVFGKIWINGTNETFNCVSYIKTYDTTELLQSNPRYTKRTDSSITLLSKEIEDREFFVTQNGLANIYWTNHNLVMDGRSYIFGVECSGNPGHLVSEKVATVNYKPVNAPITRFVWATENAMPIFLGFLIIVIIVFVGGFIWYLGKR